MDFMEVIGIVAGICTSSSVIPQLVKTVRTKKATDVSLLMFVVLLTGNSLWVYYGADMGDVPIVATNILSILLNIAMLFFKFKYKE
jgi:MtN3 and saliva related transmembrane protein